MYPKQIIDAFSRVHPEWPASGAGTAIEDWILEREATDPAVGTYVRFLRNAKIKFAEVATAMGYWNPAASHSLEHDKWSVGWAGDALLPVANYLYLMKSYGVAGDCLECGAFKGSSTACLSYVCHELGLTLYCADSFVGLPSGEGHYGAGDFTGSRAEVEDNVRRCGNIESVRFIEGWYSESLRGFAAPLSVIWMDVDLQQSVLDVMRNVMPCLAPDGVIFSDGFTEGVDMTPDHRIVLTGGEPAGFYRFFAERGMQVTATPAGPRGLALILPRPQETPWLRIDPQRFGYLTRRL